MKKVLFIDRDGTLIVEPLVDMQVDSLEKLEFLPGVISALGSIAELDYEFVLASNQDGLGTASFPEETFWPAHEKMLRTLAGEGFIFDDQLIDPSLPEQNCATRKPGIGMFGKYLSGEYDMAGSFVIGDRLTDVVLARNLGAKAILLQPKAAGAELLAKEGLEEVCVLVTDDWAEIAEFLRADERVAIVERKTSETNIVVEIDLDGRGRSEINTGIGFFDHMLWQIVHHGGVSLVVDVAGDLHVDEHHTIEDVGITLGEAVCKALGQKRGVERYGFALPMDESSALVLLDFGGRIDFVWDAKFCREYIGEIATEMFPHFFKSFAQGACCNLQISAKGENEHHKIEGIFKAFARSLKAAIKQNVFEYNIPSSKGIL